jgi:simple sugar transport system permease protein
MLCAAIAGFAAWWYTPQRLGGSAACGCRGADGGGVLVKIWLNTNQYCHRSGVDLSGAGFSAFVGIKYVQKAARAGAATSLAGDYPFVGYVVPPAPGWWPWLQ